MAAIVMPSTKTSRKSPSEATDPAPGCSALLAARTAVSGRVRRPAVTGLRARPIPQVFAQEDKLHHFIGFFALAFSCRLAFLHIKLLWLAIGCVLAGLLIEYAQVLMPLRTASIYDALANTAGVALGLAVAWGCSRNVTKY